MNNLFNQLASLLHVVAPDTRSAIVGGILGIFAGTAGAYINNARKQHQTNNAILNKNVGMQHANLTFTAYRRTKNENTTQRIRGLKSKFDLGKSFEGETKERYLEYLSRAATLASKSNTNPYVLDYLEQAIEESHKSLHGLFTRTLIQSYSQLDPKEIRNDIVRDLKKDISDFIDTISETKPGLFAGINIEKREGATLYPMFVAEKTGQHGQIKILVLREQDLDTTIVPDNEENILIRTGTKKYENSPDHPHMLRWRTTKLLVNRLRNNPSMKEEMSVQIIIPPAYRILNDEQLTRMGIIPRLPPEPYAKKSKSSFKPSYT